MNIPFQETWCILNLDSKDRVENMIKLEKDYHIDNINYVYTFKKPYYLDNIHELIPSIRTDWYDIIYNKYNKDAYKNIYDCFINHYNIIKQAYMRNLDSILIIEDDLYFCGDEKLIDYIFSKIPKDYDIIKFYNHVLGNKNITYDNIKFAIQKDCLGSTMMYALSKNGMKKYLQYFDENPPLPADMVFKHLIDKYNCKIYSLIPKIIDDSSFKNMSTITLTEQQ